MHFTDKRLGVSADDIARDATVYLDAHGISNASVAPTSPTIEDTFMARMGAPDGEDLADRGAA